MHKLVSLAALLFTTAICYCQDQPETTALNRITLNRKDTIYQFFVQKVPEKFKLQLDQDYFWFAPDTILMTKGAYDGKLLHGSYKVFYPNKNLKEEGYFEHGLRTGLWRTWTIEGRMTAMTNWVKGKKEGPFTEFGPEGNILNSGVYKDGKILSPNN